MPFTLPRFAEKLRGLKESFACTWDAVSASTGISAIRLDLLAEGKEAPSGDEVLILSDHFRCEFSWLIEDDAPNPDENVRTMFRLENARLTTQDRLAIKEFIFLCKSEALLEELLELTPQISPFSFPPKQGVYASHGKDCAIAVRSYYSLSGASIVPDIFHWLRKQGFRVFRRRLQGSPISGLFVDHPAAGRCILVNADEDLYRQRFSAAHEFGHALLDLDVHFNLSTEADMSSANYREMRANRFASHFLIPSEYLSRRPPSEWQRPEVLQSAASDLRVSVPALLSALKREKIIDDEARSKLRALSLRPSVKADPEIPDDLSSNQVQRLRTLLEMGLHRRYVTNCFEAYRRKSISWGKLAEMLLVPPAQVTDIGELFGARVDFD
jgi:Zn-dependent peptidase ImmA (M78 family)